MAARNSTSDPPVTTITRRTTTEEAPLFEDQVRNYRQGQRRRYNTHRAKQRIARHITGRGPYNQTLEQQMDPQILHRQEEGTLTLIVFRDNRWQGDQAIFAIMEIDLTHDSQLVYVIPDTMLTISDFYRNIQLSILARGYENWQHGDANILITRGLVGRLSNTPNVGFAYEVENVVDYLASHGVRALPGRRYNTRELMGQNWIIRQSTINIPMQPTEVNTRNLLDGSVSLHFENYHTATSSAPPRYNSRDEEIQSDEEELRSHTINVLVQSSTPILVKLIHPKAILPERKTPGAAGYDLSIVKEQIIPTGKMAVLETGICLQLPNGTYGRITPRSSASLRGIIIGAGVVDPDYQEFTNPFATEGGGIEEMTITGVEHDNTWLLDYPQLQKMAEQVYSQETISQYRVLANATMNPVGYPPNHPKAKPDRGNRSGPSSLNGGSNKPSQEQVQSSCSTIPDRYYQLHDEYSFIIGTTSTKGFIHPEDMPKQKDFLKSNIKPVKNYWNHSESWNKSSNSKNIFLEATNKVWDLTTSGANDCQSFKNSERIFSRSTCSSKN
ncbi:hypothetical protein ZIOFF_006047 [Zingiber officinale]|uniref:dUTP diphosphatase n=1 Tax=Zingiber officinale TaxID=94328 RepID=A0A8J5HRN4_ZINOF|nr:hypothetical protein ZIOFF_006047 [Zingiber officinale]